MAEDIKKNKGGNAGNWKGKGPKGGCHECGGDHYAHDCKIRAERKGKGKGKNFYESIPTKYWNDYNPGFQKGQWNYWRPGTRISEGSGKEERVEA